MNKSAFKCRPGLRRDDKLRRLIACLLLSAMLPGCSYLPSWMGGVKPNKPKLPGERVSVLPPEAQLTADASLGGNALALPPANGNSEWAQAGGLLTADSSNLVIGKLDKTVEAEVGEGEGFGHTQIPRPVVGGSGAAASVFAMDGGGNISAHDPADISKVRWTSNGVSEKNSEGALGGGLAYDQGRLYAVSGRGQVAALDAATGKAVWRKSLRVPFRSPPRVTGGKLYAVTRDNQIFALSADTGDVLWNERGIAENADLMGSVAPAISGDAVIAPFSSGEIYVLSAADGREIWSDSLSVTRRSGAGSFLAGIGGDPLVDGEALITVSSGGMLAVYHIPTGNRIWDKPVGGFNAPWTSGDYLYLLTADNTLACFIKYTGKVVWATRLAAFEDEEKKRRPISWHGPVMADGKLLVSGSNGQLLLVSASDGKITGSREIPSGEHTPPVVAGGRVYLLGQDATLVSLQ